MLTKISQVQELVYSHHGLKTHQKISTLHTLPKVPNYTLQGLVGAITENIYH